MPRPLRIEYEGAIYHVMNRGDRREPIFHNDKDRELFLATLLAFAQVTAHPLAQELLEHELARQNRAVCRPTGLWPGGLCFMRTTRRSVGWIPTPAGIPITRAFLVSVLIASELLSRGIGVGRPVRAPSLQTALSL